MRTTASDVFAADLSVASVDIIHQGVRRRNLRTPAERESRQGLRQHAKLSGISQRLSIKVADVTRCQTHKNTDGHSGLSHQTRFFLPKYLIICEMFCRVNTGHKAN